jgi:drug/metabolite transporter (DMT)-like permease
MSVTALILLLIAVVVHVGWNLACKRERPSAAVFLAANTFGALCLLPVLFWNSWRLPHFPARVWWILAATGCCQTLYYCCLAGAYRTGDLSVAYPLARSVAPVLVVLASVLLGRAAQISQRCLAGIGLIVVGGSLLPMRGFRDLRSRNHLYSCCGLAVLAALGTAGYSLLDDHGLRILRELRQPSFNAVEATLAYAPLEAWSASLFLSLYVVLHPRERKAWGPTLRTSKWRLGLIGLGIHLSYVLVLASMAFVKNLSYVVAFRQLSVPLGAVVGMTYLAESRAAPKLVGVALLFAGLVLVAAG